MDTHTRGNFPGGENGSKISKWAKTIGKNALRLWSILTRPSIYDRANQKKLWTASSGSPVGVTELTLLLLIVQLDKKSLQESTILRAIHFLTNFCKKSEKKNRSESESKFESKPTAVPVVQFEFSI